MSSQHIGWRSALALTAGIVTSACSGGSATLGPTSLGPAGTGAVAPLGAGAEHADVMQQGGGGVYAAGGAMLLRQPDGIRVSVTMPTPQPGTYTYPAGRAEGQPEVFTLWVFVFNHPELCSSPCDMDDLGDTPAKGGVYNGGGHVASGASMTIAGRIGVGEPPFGAWPLESPETAEIHLAVAPHGELNPSTLPVEFHSPAGAPPFWWVAIFH